MYRVDLILQDSSPRFISSIMKGITRLAVASPDFARVRVAMAYATATGCRDLCGQLESSMPLWRKERKEWLVSIDFGRTEPEAITLLGGLRNSEVRLANGRVVIDRHLIPESCFHPKTFLFDSAGNAAFGLFVGSANLTLSGLRDPESVV